jgi:hypothetical protein
MTPEPMPVVDFSVRNRLHSPSRDETASGCITVWETFRQRVQVLEAIQDVEHDVDSVSDMLLRRHGGAQKATQAILDDPNKVVAGAVGDEGFRFASHESLMQALNESFLGLADMAFMPYEDIPWIREFPEVTIATRVVCEPDEDFWQYVRYGTTKGFEAAEDDLDEDGSAYWSDEPISVSILPLAHAHWRAILTNRAKFLEAWHRINDALQTESGVHALDLSDLA